MATTSATIAVGSGIPWDGKEKMCVFHQRVTATSAKPLVASTVYRVINVPQNCLVEKVGYRVQTISTHSTNKLTLTVSAAGTGYGTALITSADVTTSTGYMMSSGSLLGVFVSGASGGTINVVPHTGNSTTLVIDVFAKAVDMRVNTTQDTDTVYTS